jgi:hypothetical protein
LGHPFLSLEDAAMSARSTRSRRDPVATHQKWVERLERFRSAGRTVAAFCAAEGVSVPAFYQWKRALAQPAESTPIPPLVPIRLTSSPVASALELTFPSGAVLRFPAHCSPDVIAAVIHAVEGRPC